MLDNETLQILLSAAESGDLDLAFSHGLLDAQLPAAHAAEDPALAVLRRWQVERVHALQARDRYRAKQQREQAKAETLREKRNRAPIPGAAMQALMRAKARAAAKRDS